MIKRTWKDALIDRLSAGTGWTLALVILWLGFVFHLWLAAHFPLTNDEAYFWDWGQKLQISYLEHPPGIAWLTALNAKWGGGLLAVRLLLPFMHALASLFLLLSLREIHPGWGPRDFMLLALATVLWPGFALLGVLALPDAGLSLFLSMALWTALRYRRKDELSGFQGFSLAFLLGLATLFHQYALGIAVGLGTVLLILRRRRLRQDLSFWVTGVGFFMLFIIPLGLSLQKQMSQGLAVFAWNGTRGLWPWVVFAVSVTPWFAWILLRSLHGLGRTMRLFPEGVPAILLGATVPLLLCVTVLSFFKPMAPQALMPAFWLLLPVAVALFADDLGRSKRSWLLAALLSIVLPSLLSRRDLRRNLVTMLGENAEPLVELTLWPDLNKGLQAVRKPILTQLPAHCPMDGYLAATRWYTVGQLHFLNRRMLTISLDRGHVSYYTERDSERHWLDCPVTLVLPEKDFKADDYRDLMTIETVTPIPLKQHAPFKYLAVAGRLIGEPKQVLQAQHQWSLHARRP